jgi:hypothetical protein
MLSAVSRRGPLAAAVVLAAAVLPDDLGFSSFHSEGVSIMRVTTSLNASVTPTAVLADASTNRHPVRAANAAPSDVGTCREYS